LHLIMLKGKTNRPRALQHDLRAPHDLHGTYEKKIKHEARNTKFETISKFKFSKSQTKAFCRRRCWISMAIPGAIIYKRLLNFFFRCHEKVAYWLYPGEFLP
jgi:hypothetical protein